MWLQAIFFKLAQMFGFFAPKTKRRVIKDIAPSFLEYLSNYLDRF